MGSAKGGEARRLPSDPSELFPLGFWWVALGGAILIAAFSSQCNRVDGDSEATPHQPSLPQHTPDSPARPWITPDGFKIGQLA